MIIAKENKYLFKNYEQFEQFTDKLYLFKKHNFNVVRSIVDIFELSYKDSSVKDFCVNGKFLSDFFTPTKQIRLQKCNSWGEFVKFTDGKEEVKQTKSNACGVHLLCPFCASRKASKAVSRVNDFFSLFDQKFIDNNFDFFSDVVNNEFNSIPSQHTKKIFENVFNQYGNILNKNWYFCVLTVKNDFDIQKVLNHLKTSLNKLRKKINHYKERNYETVFKVLGALYSIEITRNVKTGYHPHVNILMCLDEPIEDLKYYKARNQNKDNLTKLIWNSEKLSNEWLDITKDSYITSCFPINPKLNLKNDLMEVIKYALKFNDLPTDILVKIYPFLFRQRFFGSLGFFYGLGLDKIKIEEFKVDRQYIEFVMNYSKGIYQFEEKKVDIEYEILDSKNNLIDLYENSETILKKSKF